MIELFYSSNSDKIKIYSDIFAFITVDLTFILILFIFFSFNRYLLLLLITPSLYDSMEDANFDRSVANQAVTYLHNEEEWARLVLADDAAGER